MSNEEIVNEFYENWVAQNSCTAPNGHGHTLYIAITSEIEKEFEKRLELEGQIAQRGLGEASPT